MNLPVLEFPNKTDEPWFSQGLRFTCSQCGNCCSGGPGFVWVSDEEIAKLADFWGQHLNKSFENIAARSAARIAT